MAKSYCINFANCSPLARRFGVNQQILNVFINLYNQNVAPEERISPEVAYSMEELDEIYAKISAQRAGNKANKRYGERERELVIRSMGGPEALAMAELTEVFSADEMQELMQETARVVISLLDILAKRHDCTIEQYLSRVGKNNIAALFNIVTKRYFDKLQESAGVMSGQIPVGSSNIQTVEQAEKINNIVSRLFGPSRRTGRIIDSLKVMSLSVINSALGVRIHADFNLDADGSINYELADSIQEAETPMQERFMQELDAQGLEDSLSAIVSRVLMQIPRTKTVVDVEVVTLPDGKESVNPVTHTEVVRSTVFGEPLYSDPKQVARRLANVLMNATGEQDMLETLRGAGYEYLYRLLSDAKNSGLRTTFFQEFNKYNQTYRAVNLSRLSDGTISFSVSTLGRNKKEGLVSFKSRLSMGNISENSIFQRDEDSGKIQIKSYSRFYGVEEWFRKIFYTADKDGILTKAKSAFDIASPSIKESYLISLMEFLNFPVTEKGVGILLSDPSKLDAFIEAVNTIFTEAEGERVKIGSRLSEINRNINGKFFNNTSIADAINTAMSIIESTPRSFYGSRVTYEGSSLSTMIMSSPLSILAKKINSLYDRVEDGENTRDFTKFLVARYLHSTQYATRKVGDDGQVTIDKVLNRWLRDFLYCSSEYLQPCAKSIFGFSRDLGIDHVKTENLSDQQHMLLLLTGYFGGRTYATTEDVLCETEEEARELSGKLKDSKRYIALGTPVFYQRGQRQFRRDIAFIPSFITGDTNAIRQIRTIHYYEEEVLDGMCDLFLADKENQKIINYLNEKGIVFSANGKEAYTSRQVRKNGKKSRRSNADKFGILQFLNQTISSESLENLGIAHDKSKPNPTWYEAFIMKAAERLGLNPNALTADERIACEADHLTLKEVCREYMEQGFQRFKENLDSLGLLEKTADGKYVYFDGILSGDKEAMLDKRLREFYYDYKFGQYNQAHLMQVSPLFVNGVEEHQKRNKGTLTNGSPLSMEAAEDDGTPIWDYNPETGTYDFTSKVVYFRDVKVGIDKGSRTVLVKYFTRLFSRTHSAEEAAELAENHVSQFDSNSLTDGQAYRSLESYRKVLKSAGEQFWTPSHQKAYDLIMSLVTPIREARRRGETLTLSAKDIQKIEDAMAIMQPIKPINDGVEVMQTDELGAINIPFQFKYAEVPLVPELLPVGSKLRELGDAMVDFGIDMMASDKCLKKGCYGEMDLQYKKVNGKYVDAEGNVLPGMDADGKIIDDGTQTAAQQMANPQNAKKFVEWEAGTSVRDIFAAHSEDGGATAGYVVHRISMENYLLQSNIPDHTDGNSIMGTQPRKIGTGAIVNSEDYTYTIGPFGAKVSGKQLTAVYNVAHTLKYAKSYKRFADRVDDVSDVVSDLIYNIIGNGRGNLATISRLTLVDGVTPTVPFAEPSNASEVQRSLISIFKKSVIRQLISGGSIVQASSLGYGKEALADTGLHAVIDWTDEKNGEGTPIAMQTEMPFDFHYVDESGNMVNLKFEDYCDENGYFLDEYGKPITEERYGKARPLIEKDFPGITDIVAYRIPTEMEYSMFHLKIVKCNPKNANNTIKLPAECTTIAGFDFDIDKLFLMRHNFKPAKAVDEYTVWTEFYKRNPEVANALEQAWIEDGRKESANWHDYWKPVMEQYPRFAERFPSKDAAYKDVKYDIQRKLIDKTPFDYDMGPEEMAKLSQGDLDNLLVDCMVAILSDASTVGDRYSVGGFANASVDAKLMRLLMAGKWTGSTAFSDFAAAAEDMEDVKPEYDYSEPMTSVIFKEQNQIAGTLIGIFANDNVNAFISKGLKTFKITSPEHRILFGSLLEGVTELDGSVDGIDSSDIGISFLHTSVNGKEIKKTLAELLAAAVDAVKDPVLNFLNLNSITADAAAMLARLGYSTRDIGLLFNQPVIKAMCLYMDRTGETNVRRALIKVLGDMGVSNPTALFTSKASVDTSKLTQAALATGLNPFAEPDLKMQATVAQLFNSIMQTKSEFSTFIQKTRNTSANTVKSRFEDFLSSDDKSKRTFDRITIETNDEIGDPITDDITEEDLLTYDGIVGLITKYKDHPFLYENVVASIIKVGMNHMMEKYTLYRTPLYSAYRQELQGLIAPWGLSGDQIEKLYRAIPVMQIMSIPGEFNPEHMSDGETPNAVKYMDPEQFLKRLESFLIANPDLYESLAILQAIDLEGTPVNGENGTVRNSEAPRLTLKYSHSNDSIEKLALTLSWNHLMSLGGEAAEIAKGIYMHFYYTRGLNPETNVAMGLAPVSVLKSIMVDEELGISYNDFFRDNQDVYQEDLSSVDSLLEAKQKLYQFLISSSSDSKLVKTINISLEDCAGPGGKSLIFAEQSGVRLTPAKNTLDLVTLHKVMQGKKVVGVYYAPIIKVAGKTYVLAKLDGGDFVADYENFKRKRVSSLQYVLAESLIPESAVDELGAYFTEQNGLIFKSVPDSVSISQTVSDDEVITDTGSTGNSANEAYDTAKEETKDDEVESSDGRPQCHTHTQN